jgi:hypothetical protein
MEADERIAHIPVRRSSRAPYLARQCFHHALPALWDCRSGAPLPFGFERIHEDKANLVIRCIEAFRTLFAGQQPRRRDVSSGLVSGL